MVGYAYQLGALPLSADAIEQAIALNGEAVAMNLAAFHWGRRAALDPRRGRGAGAARAGDARREPPHCRRSFEETVARRVEFLTAYQNAAYAARYRALVEKVKAAEAATAPGKCGLAEAVARYLFKLMAYKDEYEVARLYTDGAFLKQVANEFGGETCASNSISRRRCSREADPATGEPRKMSFGPWMMSAFGVLAKLKFLRGTPFDIFGYSEERRTERKLIADYEAMLDEVLGKAQRPTTTRSRSGSPRSRRRSAASATSRRAISPPPRPTRRRCWSSSAPARRRC